MKFPVIFLLASAVAHGQEWSESSRWLYETLNARFEDQAGDWKGAAHKVNKIASESKQYDVYSYAFDLAINNANYDEAEKLATEWLGSYPADEEAELALLRVLFFQKEDRWEKILEHSRALIKRQPEPQIIAQISRLAGNYGKRLELFQELLKEFPENSYLYYYLGLIAKEQGQVAIALDAFDRALALDGNWKELELMRIETLSSVGQLKRALAALDKLRSRAPNDPELLSLNIDILADHYQWERAIAIGEKWLQSQPKEPLITKLLAWLYGQAGQLDKARHYYDLLLKQRELEPEEYNFQLAMVFFRAGKIEEGKKYLAKLEETDPNAERGREEMALALFRRGKFKEGREVFRQLREDYPQDGSNLYKLEVQQLIQNNQEIAPEDLEQALSLYGQSLPWIIFQGEKLAREGKFAEAEQLYLKKLEQEEVPNMALLNSYGTLLFNNEKRRAEGADLIKTAVSAYPNEPAIADSYAQVLAQEGKLAEALRWQTRAYAALKDGEISANYIDLLARNRKEELAKEVFSYEIKALPKDRHLLKVGEKYRWIKP